MGKKKKVIILIVGIGVICIGGIIGYNSYKNQQINNLDNKLNALNGQVEMQMQNKEYSQAANAQSELTILNTNKWAGKAEKKEIESIQDMINVANEMNLCRIKSQSITAEADSLQASGNIQIAEQLASDLSGFENSEEFKNLKVDIKQMNADGNYQLTVDDYNKIANTMNGLLSKLNQGISEVQMNQLINGDND